MNQWLDQILKRFSEQSDFRRAAILGAVFGLLMCVIVILLFLVFGFIASLGD
jgi:hypothetical protein